MRRGRSRAAALVALTVGAWLSGACTPDPAKFYSTLYTCDSTTASPRCGLDRDGKPMTCFPGQQLGLVDFCVPTCDTPGEQADAVCLASKAKLSRCRPSDDLDEKAHPLGACGNRRLSCMRTDLLLDEGVCVMGALCSTDADCANSSNRHTCVGTIVRQLVASPAVKVDHLTCVQTSCHADLASCEPTESCLPKVIPAQSSPPDLCAPHCDSSFNCPPNYTCYRGVSPSEASPPVCLGGLPSFKCRNRIDCLVGECAALDSDLAVCSLPCRDDHDCAMLDQPTKPQICGHDVGGVRYCVAPQVLGGANCVSDAECDAGKICAHYSPFGTDVSSIGYCLAPCPADGRCASVGGVPHSCLDYLPTPLCYPGAFGVYCSAADVCVGDLQCLPSTQMTADDEPSTGPLCTLSCSSDADCAANRWGRAASAPCENGTCVNRRPGGFLCDKGSQCYSGNCAPSERPGEAERGLRRCTLPPGGMPL